MENRIEKNVSETKKAYETPVAEKVEFQYDEQIAASECKKVYEHTGDGYCPEDEQVLVSYNN